MSDLEINLIILFGIFDIIAVLASISFLIYKLSKQMKRYIHPRKSRATLYKEGNIIHKLYTVSAGMAMCCDCKDFSEVKDGYYCTFLDGRITTGDSKEYFKCGIQPNVANRLSYKKKHYKKTFRSRVLDLYAKKHVYNSKQEAWIHT